ncbi:sedoheptulokinase-like [Haliotis cracherodii]|uniref:sedoheptulokinase-like n=1 Tax=Haliotis cracherodii TaxID=6455 RepID=UPI0039ECB2A1
MSPERRLALGIDLGTSCIKLSLIDIQTEEQVFVVSRPSKAQVESDIGSLGSEQSPGTILSTLEECLQQMTTTQQKRVAGIAVTGQGTGLIMWPGGRGCNIHPDTGHLVAGSSSNLYTWMDRRSTPEFVSSLPPPDSNIPIKAGMGWVTLQWLQKHRPGLIEEKGYDCAGTIIEYLIAGLCERGTATTSELLAYSFGYFDAKSASWNSDILEEAGFPVHMLPSLVPSGTVVGHLPRPWGHIQDGVPVYVGAMDTQCAVHSVRPGVHDAVFYIGTSTQLGYVITDASFDPNKRAPDTPANLEYQPFFHGGHYASCNGLDGGNVLEAFVKMLYSWLQDLGAVVDEETIWRKLPSLAQDATSSNLNIDPKLFGTFFQPSPSCSHSAVLNSAITFRVPEQTQF